MKFIRSILAVWAEACRIVKEKANQDAAVQARYAAALAFNSIWTYDAPTPAAARWMCPVCNKVHLCTGELTVFTGLQFPACCNFIEGHRQFKSHATKQGQG